MSKTFHITEIVSSKWIETWGYYPISFILISKAVDLLVLFVVTGTRRGQRTRVSFSSLSFFFPLLRAHIFIHVVGTQSSSRKHSSCITQTYFLCKIFWQEIPPNANLVPEITAYRTYMNLSQDPRICIHERSYTIYLNCAWRSGDIKEITKYNEIWSLG